MSKRPLEPGTQSRIRVFRVGPDLESRLNRLASREGTTPSDVIRRALEHYVDLKEGVEQ